MTLACPLMTVLQMSSFKSVPQTCSFRTMPPMCSSKTLTMMCSLLQISWLLTCHSPVPRRKIPVGTYQLPKCHMTSYRVDRVTRGCGSSGYQNLRTHLRANTRCLSLLMGGRILEGPSQKSLKKGWQNSRPHKSVK
ncbi:SPATA31 subfamily E member 1 [Phyllostomus discolor]|uniref:SPATA31 subfamily E member 1 n=1 Tax=Phyllostomus discolor TaxID=89673 RepID=A0A834BG77_9CHIR|nr:SPATA31 subfamily E member 1 [Phyllostomus discolor]